MSVAKVVTAQRDFTGGEADAALKRADDHPQLKSTARQMSNWRQLSTRALTNRPGRRILAREGSRVDEVIMSPGNTFYLVFGNGYLRVYNAAFALIFNNTTMPWSAATATTVVWDIYKFSVYICFDGMQPRVLTWDGVSQTSPWTLALYTERITGSGQKRTPFYRLSPRDVTMSSTALTGATLLTFSAAILSDPGHAGTRMRYTDKQALLLNSFHGATGVDAIIQETFPWSSTWTNNATVTFADAFAVGEELIGETSGGKAIVISIAVGGLSMVVQHLTSIAFLSGNLENVVGPNGTTTINTGSIHQAPQAIVVWDDEVMNSFRGWPRSCFVDQGRLGFCDFPALPQLIVWSAVGDFTDLYTDANNVAPTNAIQELVPGKSRVLYVVPGADGSEFVFCDNAVYSIPINQNNPLKPGSVAFNTLISEGCAQVQPRPVQQSIVYVSAGFQQFKAVQAIGAYNRPYIVDDISVLHQHLLATPVAIAAPAGSDQFEESYFYVSNADGTLVLCSYDIANGLIDTKTIGWLPWSGGGTATWVSALKGHSDVLVSGTYAPNGISAVSVVEQVDATQYLDAGMLYNSVPTSLTPPVGKGPLWWLAGGTVDLMDGGRMMGTYTVDANGFLIPQNNAGEDFTSATLSAGQAWTAVLEPWVPAVQPGQDVQQRLRKRRIMRFVAYVTNSTGFTMNRIAGAPQKRTDPAAGTIMSRRRIPAWNQDDDPTQAPPLREQSYSIRPTGRYHDPRVAIIKDTPGPLTILESDLEVTV